MCFCLKIYFPIKEWNTLTFNDDFITNKKKKNSNFCTSTRHCDLTNLKTSHFVIFGAHVAEKCPIFARPMGQKWDSEMPRSRQRYTSSSWVGTRRANITQGVSAGWHTTMLQMGKLCVSYFIHIFIWLIKLCLKFEWCVKWITQTNSPKEKHKETNGKENKGFCFGPSKKRDEKKRKKAALVFVSRFHFAVGSIWRSEIRKKKEEEDVNIGPYGFSVSPLIR